MPDSPSLVYPTKVNVSLRVHESTSEWCRDINASLRELTESVVHLGRRAGNSTPHVTIAMGVVGSKDSLSALCRTVVDVALRSSPMQIRLSAPYRERVTGRYVFTDVVESPGFAAWRSHLNGELDGQLEERARTSDVAHITLGHVESKQESVDTLLASIDAPKGFIGEVVDVAVGGPKGTRGPLIASVAMLG